MKTLFKALAAALIMIALLFALTSCADIQQAAEECADASTDCTATVIIDDTPTDDDGTPPTDDDATTDTPADPEPIEDEQIDDDNIRIVITIDTPPTFTPLFVLQIDNSVYLSDTNERHLLMQGQIDKAGPALWLIDNLLLQLDATADALILDHTPTQARQTETALYTCVEVDPATASAAGAQSEYYTEFFIDSISTGHWVTNQMRCTDIVSAGGYTFAVSETGALVQIDGPATTPLYILDGEFVTHNLDSINNRIDFNSSTESYTMNFLTAASQWIKHDSGGADNPGGAVSYYSETGYIWDATNGLQELVTVLGDFNTDPRPVALPFGQAPTLISAGTRDGLIYWIEGNTGWLIEYDPINDAITTPYRLYSGDGTRATGTIQRDTLKPSVIAEYVYFSYGVELDGTGGILKRLDLETGFFDEVYSGEATLFLID